VTRSATTIESLGECKSRANRQSQRRTRRDMRQSLSVEDQLLCAKTSTRREQASGAPAKIQYSEPDSTKKPRLPRSRLRGPMATPHGTSKDFLLVWEARLCTPQVVRPVTCPARPGVCGPGTTSPTNASAKLPAPFVPTVMYILQTSSRNRVHRNRHQNMSAVPFNVVYLDLKKNSRQRCT